MRQIILLVDDDHHITDALGMALDQPGRTVVVCSDVESAELVLERFAVTDLVTDVQFSGMFGFEGLHFVQRLRAKNPAFRVVMMTGRGTEDLRHTAESYGASALLNKPFDLDELERVLGVPSGNEPYELLHVPSIDEILDNNLLDVAFQPIVASSDGFEPFAFEALLRVRGGWAAGGPAELCAYAERRSRAVELNRAAVIRAIESAAALRPSASIFVNVDPHAFNDPRLVSDVVAASERSGVTLDRLVLEITERTALIDDAITRSVLEALRTRGIRFALDDHGSAYSHLSTISNIRPSFVKISQTFGTDMENDPDKQRVVRHVVALAHDFGCAAILEGIESLSTAAAAAEMGVELVQGYYFSRPREVSYWQGAAA